METGLELPLYEDWRNYANNFCEYMQEIQITKNMFEIFKKSMQIIQLKLFNAVLKHAILESNKKAFKN